MVRAGGGGGGAAGSCNVHHVTLVVLVVTQRQQDDVALVDPDLLAKLAADVAESAGTVEALRLQTAVSRWVVSTCIDNGISSRGRRPAREMSGCFVAASRAPGWSSGG